LGETSIASSNTLTINMPWLHRFRTFLWSHASLVVVIEVISLLTSRLVLALLVVNMPEFQFTAFFNVYTFLRSFIPNSDKLHFCIRILNVKWTDALEVVLKLP